MLTYAASLVCASVKVLEESATPDVQILFANASFAPGPIRRLDDKPGMTGGMWQMRPLSTRLCRGEIARSRAPRRRSTRATSRTTPTGARRSADCARCGGCSPRRRSQPYVVGEILPGTDVESDDELLDYLRQTGSTVFHATCTCKMGRDPMAVVDDQLRVHGSTGCASSTPR